MVHQLSVSCTEQSPLDCYPGLSHTRLLLSKADGWYPWSAQGAGVDWEMGPGPGAGVYRPGPHMAEAVLAKGDL